MLFLQAYITVPAFHSSPHILKPVKPFLLHKAPLGKAAARAVDNHCCLGAAPETATFSKRQLEAVSLLSRPPPELSSFHSSFAAQ